MRILFDQNVPRAVRRVLVGHLIRTANQCGWKGLANGELLAEAERAGFDAFVTADRNLTYQQNLNERTIALVVLGSVQLPLVRQHLSSIAEAVDAACPGSYAFIDMPLPPKKRRNASNERDPT